ncbi:ATP-binding protein [Cellulomonas cellasea]|uniref:SARP family transcriptional regulator n=1 Tax=Cellulomonas cellasea TaxID=43670 RepID=A0A4Y3KT17_9CELL|nr:BTAD domain-containing putative transcriptional regulator [Cellulomonas cellasea]GEA86716.1 SARP family transcriptional regulator [Cellulomonas cellasea]
MQITTLGTLAVDGRPVRGARLVALVRALVDARGRSVSVAALAEAVWDGAAPDDAAGALQALVSRARRTGLRVTSGPAGYALAHDPADIDAVRAAATLRRGRDALRTGHADDADRCAAEALALVGADVPPGTTAVHDDPAHLRLLAGAVALRVEAALAGGTDPGPLDVLRALALRTPPDEPLVALLVRALAAQGRDAEALDVLEGVRAGLAERFGTDPSGVVAQVHVALLRGELAPGAPTGPPTGPATAAGEALAVGWRRAVTGLVGREVDVAAAESALADQPLVTLVGLGGAGKTRLALEVARRAAERGVAVHAVELAGLREPSEVLPALLSAVGAAESVADPDRPQGRRVLGADERLQRVAEVGGLLVLDNCEHLLDAVADVAARLIALADRDLRVLATSRAPLAVPGETVQPVLALPDADALQLLGTRARAVRPDLAWDPDVAAALCLRLDNLPLALELAAARVRSMPLTDVLAGLDDRFALLDHALRGMPERHAGLRAMVDWSWSLLTDDERVLLMHVAVVPAPFTAATAVHLVGPDAARAPAGPGAARSGAARPEVATTVAGASGPLLGETRARRALGALVEQSLLVLEEPGRDASARDAGGHGGEAPARPGAARYRMLETVREYGEQRLAELGDPADARDRLVRWAVDEAHAVAEMLAAREHTAGIRRAGAEQESLLAALRWAVERRREREAMAVGAALLALWTVRGLHAEVDTWAAVLLGSHDPELRATSWALHGPRTDAPPPEAEDVATVALHALVNSGIAGTQRRGAVARRVARRALASPAAVGRGRVRHRTAALVRAMDALTSVESADGVAAAEALAREDDPSLAGMGLFLRSALRENLGDVDLSLRDAHAAYDRFASVGDLWGMGMAAQGIGQWEGGRGGAGADVWLERAEDHLRAIGAVADARAIAVVRHVHRALRGETGSRAALEDVVAAPASGGASRAHASVGLAALAALEDRWDDAVRHADEALAVARDDPAAVPQARVVYVVCAAVIRLRAGHDSEALLRSAVPEAVSTKDAPVLGSLALGFAELAASRGEHERARTLWALGTRLGASIALIFGPAFASLLHAHVGDGDERTALLAEVHDLTSSAAVSRIVALLR